MNAIKSDYEQNIMMKRKQNSHIRQDNTCIMYIIDKLPSGRFESIGIENLLKLFYIIFLPKDDIKMFESKAKKWRI